MTEQSLCDSDVEDTESVLLEGWTKGDTFNLLQGVKNFGSEDVASISQVIPHKTLPEIRHAVQFYKNRALKKYYAKKVNKPKGNVIQVVKSSAPLSNWATTLLEKFGSDQLQTMTATAVRMIADCEVRPDPASTENVDFAKAYHLLADAMDGKTFKFDKNLEMLVNHCMHETATYSRSFIKKPVLKSLLDNTFVPDEDISHFPLPSSDTEAATMSQLAVQNNYNPLKIPEEYLKVPNYY